MLSRPSSEPGHLRHFDWSLALYSCGCYWSLADTVDHRSSSWSSMRKVRRRSTSDWSLAIYSCECYWSLAWSIGFHRLWSIHHISWLRPWSSMCKVRRRSASDWSLAIYSCKRYWSLAWSIGFHRLWSIHHISWLRRPERRPGHLLCVFNEIPLVCSHRYAKRTVICSEL